MDICNAIEAQQTNDFKLIGKFNEYLSENISKKTVRKHVDNMELYTYYHNSYVYDKDEIKPLSQLNSYMVIDFLSSWVLRKTHPSSLYQLDSYLSTFKKFYQWLQLEGQVTKSEYEEFINELKDQKYGIQKTWNEFLVRVSFY